MGKQSAGILMYRRGASGALEVLLIHPGGPYWQHKDAGAWSIPKGGHDDGEAAIDAARREFREETGFEAEGELLELTPIKQKSGKLVRAWAVEGNLDASAVKSNLCRMEWPPKSGRYQEFPEVDRAGWFTLEKAHEKLLDAQRSLLDELGARLGERPSGTLF